MTSENVIHLRDVSKAFGMGPGGTEVLRSVSLDVRQGEIVALVGQSGSGKSTLLNIAGGLDVADSGKVEIFGVDYSTASEQALAHLRNRSIGFVFQAFHLLDHLDCLANVTLPAMFCDGPLDVSDRGAAALARVGLEGYETRRPSELSGGQRQRVAIARALFNRPKLLLCDEPTGNLDSETGDQIIAFFQEVNQEDGTTLFMVTHEPRVSQVAHRVLHIRDGRIEGEPSACGEPS